MKSNIEFIREHFRKDPVSFPYNVLNTDLAGLDHEILEIQPNQVVYQNGDAYPYEALTEETLEEVVNLIQKLDETPA